MQEKRIVSILGGPGSGKGTQCSRIAKEYGWAHVSVGELLRSEVEQGTELGKEIDGYLKEGKLVPTETAMRVLPEKIKQNKAEQVLLDGFPRNCEQAEAWDKVKHFGFVLVLEVSEEVCKERLMSRGRDDDTPETISKRLRLFHEETQSVLEHYKKQGLLRTVDADGSEDEVYGKVKQLFDELKAKHATDSTSTTADKAEHAADSATAAKPGQSPYDIADETKDYLAEPPQPQQVPKGEAYVPPSGFPADSDADKTATEITDDLLLGDKQSGAQATSEHDSRVKGEAEYLNDTVVPALREGLHALLKAKPEAPLAFLGQFLTDKHSQVRQQQAGQ